MRTLEEVRRIRDEISKLGERNFPSLEAEQNRAEAEYNKAKVECDKAMAERNKTGEGWYETRAELGKAVAEWDKMVAEWDEAKVRLNKAGAEWDIKLFDILTSVCPEAHYRESGYLGIPKNEDEDELWIIPVFSGNYKSMEHTAFSIWEMPRHSCNGSEAKEVKDE
ncbi:MAG: hypothetical protein DDT23_00688 [candidate division WS2 bacterium]|nr:hypothetical protein [Candidatus Lithacetigena glycinireducens]